ILPLTIAGGKPGTGAPLNLIISKTTQLVIVGHADGLHERITDRRTDKFAATANQVPAKCIRFRGMGLRDLAAFAFDRSSIYESPDIFIETAKLFLDLKKSPGVPDC